MKYIERFGTLLLDAKEIFKHGWNRFLSRVTKTESYSEN